MREKVDFLFRYEHKAREIESLMLLKIELERRGYTVAYVANYDYKRKRSYYAPKVFIAPAVYNNSQLKGDYIEYGLLKKIANMQWEQVYPGKYEYSFSPYISIKEIGDKIVNFCWGINSRDRIIRDGVSPEKAVLVGDISLDLLRGNFSRALSTKEIVAAEYGLDRDKKWYLFISSFTSCEMDDIQKKLAKIELGNDFDMYVDLSIESRAKILDWFEKLVKNDPESIVIYRPHPNESKSCERLKIMERTYPNFRVIGNGALKHWVNVCDKTYNWISSGIIDVIMLDRPYRMLRPIPVPKDYDYKFMQTAHHITTISEFLEEANDFSVKEVISKEILKKYYKISDEFAYQNICDVLEDMLNTSKYDVNYSISEMIKLYSTIIKAKFFSLIENSFIPFVPKSLYPSFYKKRLQERESVKNILINGYDRNVASQEELEEIRQRLQPIVCRG